MSQPFVQIVVFETEGNTPLRRQVLRNERPPKGHGCSPDTDYVFLHLPWGHLWYVEMVRMNAEARA